MPKDDIRLDAIGELRHIRRSIVHAGSNAEPEVARNRFLPRFKRGQRIVIDAQAFELATDMIFSDSAQLELATVSGSVAAGLIVALTVAV